MIRLRTRARRGQHLPCGWPGPAPLKGASMAKRKSVPPNSEHARYLELLELVKAKKKHKLSFAVFQEFGALARKYKHFVIDQIFIGPVAPGCVPRATPIYPDDCKTIPGAKPLACPRAKPLPPASMLPAIDKRFREVGLIGPKETILWVGKQDSVDSLCAWGECGCFNQVPSAAAIDTMPQFVTLDQAAATVSRSKRTLEKFKDHSRHPLPTPDIEGGGGKADEWDWDNIRPWLESEYNRQLPKKFSAKRS